VETEGESDQGSRLLRGPACPLVPASSLGVGNTLYNGKPEVTNVSVDSLLWVCISFIDASELPSAVEDRPSVACSRFPRPFLRPFQTDSSDEPAVDVAPSCSALAFPPEFEDWLDTRCR